MTIVARGTVQNGVIVTEAPLELPDRTEVVVSVVPARAGTDDEADRRLAEFDALGFHGMWADREDMQPTVLPGYEGSESSGSSDCRARVDRHQHLRR